MNVFIAFACILQVSNCQSVPTSVGVITCDHCETPGEVTLRVPGQDLKLLPSDGRKHFSLSSADPDHFFCRRGTRYKLSVSKTEPNQWIVDREFYPGESGLAVFDSDGNAVGLVLGNRLVDGSWRGRVARFDSFVRSVVVAPNVSHLIRQRFLRLDIPVPATLDPFRRRHLRQRLNRLAR